MSSLRFIALAGFALLAGLLVPLAPAQACLACSVGGECLLQPAGLSGNCKCILKERGAFMSCTPSGVCDAADPHSCDEEPGSSKPWNGPIPAKGLVIEPAFLREISERDPVLGAALWSAVEDEYDRSGHWFRATFNPGEHTGTLGAKDGRSYAFRVLATRTGEEGFTFHVTLTNHRTGEVSELRGHFADRGRLGEIAKLRLGTEERYLDWDLAGNPKPEQK